MAKVVKVVDSICDKASYVAMAATFILMMMTSIHVILRKFTVFSVPGALEMTELLMVVIVFAAMAYMQSVNGHIRVDMLVEKFPKRFQHILSFVILLVSAAVLVVLFYAALIQIPEQFQAGLATSNLGIPIWPFYIVMAVGLILYALSLFVHSIQELIAFVTKKEPTKA